MVRERVGLNQDAFAEKLKVTPTTINRYEKGHRIPDAAFLDRLVQKFNCEPGWLLTGKAYAIVGHPPEGIISEEVTSYRPEKERIGNILLKNGAVNEGELQKALEEQRSLERDPDLEEILRYFVENPRDKKFCLKMIRGKKEIKEAVEGFASKNLIKDEG